MIWIIPAVGYLLIALLILCQGRRALSSFRPELRRTHGRRAWYVRNRATGRVVMQTRSLFDLLALGV